MKITINKKLYKKLLKIVFLYRALGHNIGLSAAIEKYLEDVNKTTEKDAIVHLNSINDETFNKWIETHEL